MQVHILSCVQTLNQLLSPSMRNWTQMKNSIPFTSYQYRSVMKTDRTNCLTCFLSLFQSSDMTMKQIKPHKYGG